MNQPPVRLELIALDGKVLNQITLEENGNNTKVTGNFLTPGNYLASINKVKRIIELKARKDYGKTITINYNQSQNHIH